MYQYSAAPVATAMPPLPPPPTNPNGSQTQNRYNEIYISRSTALSYIKIRVQGRHCKLLSLLYSRLVHEASCHGPLSRLNRFTEGVPQKAHARRRTVVLQKHQTFQYSTVKEKGFGTEPKESRRSEQLPSPQAHCPSQHLQTKALSSPEEQLIDPRARCSLPYYRFTFATFFLHPCRVSDSPCCGCCCCFRCCLSGFFCTARCCLSW